MAELKEPRLQARQGVSEQEWSRPPPDHGQIELGTVGWQDGSSHVDVGTGSNDGNTLVKVQLFRGRDPREKQTPDRGQGAQILARCSASHIPVDGNQVLVARPAGFDGPGVWTIISILGPGAGPILPADGGTFIRQGRDGRVSIGTTTDGTADGELVCLQVGRDGLTFFGPWGKVTFGQGGFHVLHNTGARLDLGGIGGLPTPLDIIGSYAVIGAGLVKLQASGVASGPDAGAPEQVAKALSTLTALNEIGTWATSVDAAIAAIGTGLSTLGYVAAGAAVTAEHTAYLALGTALTAAAAAIPSQSTTAT